MTFLEKTSGPVVYEIIFYDAVHCNYGLAGKIDDIEMMASFGAPGIAMIKHISHFDLSEGVPAEFGYLIKLQLLSIVIDIILCRTEKSALSFKNSSSASHIS